MYELRRVYKLFIGEILDKRNFRQKIIALDQIEETGEKREYVLHQPARSYQVMNAWELHARCNRRNTLEALFLSLSLS